MRERTYEASHQTKQQICASLKTLMGQKPLNKITVSEVMKPCGMARQHFYYHFEDINDAVRWMFENEAVVFLREHEGSMRWQDGLLPLFQYVQDNRAVCLCALHSLGRDHLKRFFQTELNTITRKNIQTVLEQMHGRPSEEEIALMCRFYVGALVNILEDFLLGEIEIPPEQIIRFVERLLQAHMQGAMSLMRGLEIEPRRLEGEDK